MVSVRPEMREGRASGRRTLNTICEFVEPMVLAAWMTPGSTSLRAVSTILATNGAAAMESGTIVVNVSRVLDDRGLVTTRPRVIDVEEQDGACVFRLEEDEATAPTSAPAASVGAVKQIERAEKILFKAVRSINKHVEKGDFAPNLHYIDQLDDVRATLAPFAADHPLVGVYLARLDEVAASRAQGWRLRVGDVPRFEEGT